MSEKCHRRPVRRDVTIDETASRHVAALAGVVFVGDDEKIQLLQKSPEQSDTS